MSARQEIHAKGGTELLHMGLLQHVSPELLEQVHLSVSATHDIARHLKPHVFWAHQSYDQPSVQNLKDLCVQDAIDRFVFVSSWQQEQYQRYLHIPRERSVVIPNAIVPIPSHTKPKTPLKLIYTATPFRGLDVLLNAFAALDHPDVELHIYSGMSLYGRPQEDAQFTHLYETAHRMPNVHYHGVVSNEEIRSALQEAHIFAYPCTWEETSCLSLIEALNAGCRAVVPHLGALSETASGFAQLYTYAPNKREHAQRFAQELNTAIDTFWSVTTQQRLHEQKIFFDREYAWSVRKGEWEALLRGSLAEKAILASRKA